MIFGILVWIVNLYKQRENVNVGVITCKCETKVLDLYELVCKL